MGFLIVRRDALLSAMEGAEQGLRMGQADEPQAPPRPVVYHAHDFDWASLREGAERALSAQAAQRAASGSKGSDGRGPARGGSSAAAWEAFHRRHARVNFFKERRYVLAEFPELACDERPLLILEVGCGTGSTCIPILRGNARATVVACDCSAAAVSRAAAAVADALGPREGARRFFAFVHDLAAGSLGSHLQSFLAANLSSPAAASEETGASSSQDPAQASIETTAIPGGSPPAKGCGGVLLAAAGPLPHIVLLMFTLSALEPEDMGKALQELFSVLQPGGLLLFRDYGLHDMSMLRFHGCQRLDETLYRREDGTLVTFFTPESVADLFLAAGFAQIETEFCCVQHQNRSTGAEFKRVFVHAKFVKPACSV